MDLELVWHAPFPLRDGSRERLIYACDSLDDVPNRPGIYIFGRMYGDVVEPIYIGKAEQLRVRVRQHLEGNIRLMKSIEGAKNGARVVQVAEWIAKRGQQALRVLPTIERALIKSALAA